MRLPLCLLLISLLLISPAAAQDLDPQSAPLYGTVPLQYTLNGTSPDPHITTIFALSIDLQTDVSTLSSSCSGLTSTAPMVRYTLPEGTSPDLLRLMFLTHSGVGAADAALLVYTPAGEWACVTTNSLSAANPNVPALDLSFPTAGDYAVWIASTDPEANRLSGYLLATFNDANTPERIQHPALGALALPEATAEADVVQAVPTPSATPDPSMPLNVNAAPVYGTGSLAAGFLPDPFRVEALSGGGTDAGALDLGDECRGFVTAEPTFRLEMTSESPRLRVMFMPNVQGDTTLLIYLPDGTWRCNDDFVLGLNVNPMVEFAPAPIGTYAIYLGSYTLGQTIDGAIFITEQDVTPQNN